jgi:DNA-binding transcriptional LysR family regulator
LPILRPQTLNHAMTFEIDSLTLKSFIAIVELGSFTLAGARVGRSQSAVSLQIQKLESQLACALLDRSQRKISLTLQGEIFLSYARRSLSLKAEVLSRLKEPDAFGDLRLGTPEDFATHYLPDILSSFQRHHPRVHLNVDCDLTLNLISGFERGNFDIILVKRDPEVADTGTRVWREPLVWAGAAPLDPHEPLSLVLSPQPCIYRKRALKALDKAQRPWRLSYTSPSLAGTLAAVRAGLGISVLPSHMLPKDIQVVSNDEGLPKLDDAEIALMKRSDLSHAAQILARHITLSLEGLSPLNAQT